jgi:hypothetical protein
MGTNNKLTKDQSRALLELLELRFSKNASRHKGISWEEVKDRLLSDPRSLWSLNEMERTGGEPDVVGTDPQTNAIIFFDCSPESPSGRRSLCYDREGWESRKDIKPENTAVDMASEMGIELMTEADYKALQKVGKFDAKTSSWLSTPAEIRKLGGAIFGDYRYGTVFIYHNGAQSFYAARGFRGVLRVK